MSEPVEQCSRHFGDNKHACPFTEAKIGGDYDARALVKFAEQMEEYDTGSGEHPA